MGIPWAADTLTSIRQLEGLVPAEEAAGAIRKAADDLEPLVRSVTGVTVRFPIVIENVAVDDYWSYWLDGNRDEVRLRLNLREASFTEVQARQFALHEVLGHGLQYVSIAETTDEADVPWVRLFSVHAPTQVLFEGLAQALPLLATPGDDALVARVRLEHYLQLVRAEVHLAINAGASIARCIEHVQTRVPFWQEAQIVSALHDRSSSALLRSYLWSYPAGLDWFVCLIDSDPKTAMEIAHAAYRSPLTPRELASKWRAGPPIGGAGESIRIW